MRSTRCQSQSYVFSLRVKLLKLASETSRLTNASSVLQVSVLVQRCIGSRGIETGV